MAWEKKRDWNGSLVDAYRDYAVSRATDLYVAGRELDCGDLALTILIEFAKDNNLPLIIEAKVGRENKYKVLDSENIDWSSWKKYLEFVLDNVETNEIASYYGNTYEISLNELSPGDMLVHSRANSKTRGHLQVVASSTLASSAKSGPPSSGEARIYQGNQESTWYFGSEPTEVQSGVFYMEKGRLIWHRDYNGKKPEDFTEKWKNLKVTPIRWNFNQFNEGVNAEPRNL